MATVTVKHATKTGAPADPLALVDGVTWDNDPHVITGVDQVDNTSDVNKPVSTAQATADALVASNAAIATALKANIASPALTGVPTAPTAAPLNNTTQIATTAYTDAAATALSGAVATALALKAPLASPSLTGVPVAPTATPGTATTQLATTAFVDAARVILVAADALKAPLASPALTGAPTAPTAALSTNTTQIATTAFVLANAGAGIIPQNYLSGLGTANNGTNPTTDIDISPGMAADSTNATLMVLPATLTKRLSVNWVVGNGGGLDTGTVADGTYHLWLIQRLDTGVVDAVFSLSPSAPNLTATGLTPYTAKRIIFSVVRLSGTIRTYVQTGNKVVWVVPIADYSAVGSLGTSAISKVISVPLGRQFEAFGVISGNVNATTNVVIYDLATSNPHTSDFAILRIASSGTATIGGASWRVNTNALGQIGVILSATGASVFLSIATEGYYDYRGQ